MTSKRARCVRQNTHGVYARTRTVCNGSISTDVRTLVRPLLINLTLLSALDSIHLLAPFHLALYYSNHLLAPFRSSIHYSIHLLVTQYLSLPCQYPLLFRPSVYKLMYDYEKDREGFQPVTRLQSSLLLVVYSDVSCSLNYLVIQRVIQYQCVSSFRVSTRVIASRQRTQE